MEVEQISPPKLRRHSLAPANTLRLMNKRILPDVINNFVHKREDEYVKVSKSEYEAFKTRLNSIETKITLEFNSAKLDSIRAGRKSMTMLNGPEKVENKFNETMQEVEKFEDNERKTEQLAKRLSRDLKIRPHIENPIIRSPSARKIGSLRRRQSETNRRLSRNQSWHLGPSVLSSKPSPNQQSNSNELESADFVSSLNFHPKPNLKRARLVDPNNGPYSLKDISSALKSAEKAEKIVPEKPIRKMINAAVSENWTPATEFFNDPRNGQNNNDENDDKQTSFQNDVLFKTPNRPKKLTLKNEFELTPMLPPRMTPTPSKRNTPMSCDKRTPIINRTMLLTPSSLNDGREARASIIQIRNQNAGMVAQKARLFDGLSSSDVTKSSDKCPLAASAAVRIPRVVINKTIENVKKMSSDKVVQKLSNNVPLNSNNNCYNNHINKSPRRSSRSPGVNRRAQLRVATSQSPALKTIKENRENIDRRIDLLKSELLSEIASPRKREKKILNQMNNNTPRRKSKTPTSSKKHRNQRQTPSKSPRIPRRHNISFD